ncbi:MAG: metal ABC transporter permease [Pirellulales bacterium]|nr:metal ABC transporter permease [Pirellulales bacterium]
MELELLGISTWRWDFDGWIVAAGILCAVAAALLGNFLVLRRMSMLGDAISHAVLPGLAAAFIYTSSRNSLPMFLGAAAVGILTAFFTEWIRGVGKVDEGASMGVVFTSLFALGLVMIVQAADHVDLDPDCVLYGSPEYTPMNTVFLAGWEVPISVITLGIVATVNAAFVIFFYKELKFSSFDPSLSTTTGFSATLMHYMLVVLVAVTAVASFESVGNILVVAMFVVPPATAYLLTDRLAVMILLSLVLACVSAVLGHLGAIAVPRWFGFASSLPTAGMMAVSTGLIFSLTVAFSPKQGVLVKFVRRRILAWSTLADDIVGVLYRREERSKDSRATREILRSLLLADAFSLRMVLRWLRFRGELIRHGERYELTQQGRARAQDLVRSHRLWEQYLVSQAGLDEDRIHDKAEKWEHVTDLELRRRLRDETNAPRIDPHGTPIPDERAEAE